MDKVTATLLEWSISALPKGAKFMEGTNPDGNGNFQTITYYIGSDNTTAIIRQISMTYNGSGNVQTLTVIQD
jgi:hypothetical protein